MTNEQSLKEILMELRELKQLKYLEKPVLTFQEFCVFANLSEDYVRKLHHEGKIPFNRPFGRKLYITRENALALLQQNTLADQTSIGNAASTFLLNSKTKNNGNLY
jgi:excisionase family DNA binding protein